MNKEEFVLLQQQYQQSGKSLKAFLKDAGICYSKYNYWNKKNDLLVEKDIFVSTIQSLNAYDYYL